MFERVTGRKARLFGSETVTVTNIEYPSEIAIGDYLRVKVHWNTDKPINCYLTWSLMEPPQFNTYRLSTSTTVQSFSAGSHLTEFKPVKVVEGVPANLNMLRVSIIERLNGDSRTVAEEWREIWVTEAAPPEEAPPVERWYPGYLLGKIREIIGR